MKKILTSKNLGYYITFLSPIIIMLFYFILIGAYPFGTNTIMTVDLGQQYVDFFGLFTDTILKHPESFFYSFSKDIGGDMIGVWSYYLLSPLNFILLFFKRSDIEIPILIITLIKYGLTSTSFYFFSNKTIKLNQAVIWSASISYSLSGYFIANQFNIMWLDAGYMLPLVALGINLLFKNSKNILYVFSLAGILIINYYMGYMIVIFSGLYFIYLASVYYTSIIKLGKQLLVFITYSLSAALISAFITLPTFFQLTQSKGTHTIKIIHWNFEYAPFKMLTKFNIGAFNFDAISKGYPNIYIPGILLCCTVLFFFIKKIPIRIRFTAFLITLFLLLSMCFEPLDLLWHGMQFPVWYPYRFSYIVIFWLITLSLQMLHYLPNLNIKILIIPSLFFILIIYLSIFYQKQINYLDFSTIIITSILFVSGIAIIGGIINKYKFINLCLPLFIILESVLNAYISLNNIGFISQTEFNQYVTDTGALINKIQKKDSGFYRIGKSFERTHNDGMLLDFNGTDQFNSMLEPSVTSLYSKLGQPQSDSDVIYGNGNIFLDSILGIKYILTTDPLPILGNKPNNLDNIFKPIGNRSDFQNYGNIFRQGNLVAKENPYALSIGYLVSKNVLKHDLYAGNPILNYNTIFNNINNDPKDLFLSFYGFSEKLVNLHKKMTTSSTTYTKIKSDKPAKIIINLKPQTNDPYYVSLNGDLSDNKISYKVDNKELNQNQTIQNTIVQSLFQNKQGKPVKYELSINTNKIHLYDFSFYSMNMEKFLMQNNFLQKNQLKITKFKQNRISGNISVNKKDQVIFFNIPYANGWHATVDNKKIAIKKAFKNFITVPVNKGNHYINIYYVPPYFGLGIIISISTIILLIIWKYLTLRVRV